MALKTLGTVTTSSLTAIPFGGNAASEVAAISQAILDDINVTHPNLAGAFTTSGIVTLPGGRGVITMKPGDWIGVDANGGVIVVPKNSTTDGSATITPVWTHT